MKPFIHIALSLSLLVFGQTTSSAQGLNITLDLEHPYSNLTGVVVTDSCYYVSGLVWSDELIIPQLVVSRVSFEGEELANFFPFHDERALQSNNDMLLLLNDGNLAIAGNVWSEEVQASNSFILILTTSGEILSFFEFEHPYFPLGDFFVPRTFSQDAQGNFLLVSNVSNGSGYNYTYCQKIAPSGEELWSFEFGQTFYSNVGGKIIDLDEGYLLVGGRSNHGSTNNNFFFNETLLLLNKETGEITEQITLDTELEFFRLEDVMQNEDGSLTACGALGMEDVLGPNSSQLRFQSVVVSFNLDGSVNWIQPTSEWQLEGFWTNITPAEYDWFTVSGWRIVSNLEFIGNEDLPAIRGNIARIDDIGYQVWENIPFFEEPTDYLAKNFTYDMAPINDDGVVVVGYVLDPINGFQKGWIFTADQLGCVVNLCPWSSVEEVGGSSNLTLSIAPNPATEFVNVEVFAQTATTGTLTLTDLQGRTLVESNVTHLTPSFKMSMPVQGIASGVYLLNLRTEDGNRLSKKVVID
jgi:hypothetical protein